MRFGQTLDMEMMWLSLAMSLMLWMNHWWGRPFGACGKGNDFISSGTFEDNRIFGQGQ